MAVVILRFGGGGVLPRCVRLQSNVTRVEIESHKERWNGMRQQLTDSSELGLHRTRLTAPNQINCVAKDAHGREWSGVSG